MSASNNIESVEKTMKLLEILALHNGTMTVTQLADILDCSVSSANRFLQTLSSTGYVQKNAMTNRYELTYKLNRLANLSGQHNQMLQQLIPVARAVSQKYEISVNLNGFCGKEAVLLFPVTLFYNKDLDFSPGHHAPAYCTSSGKAILSTFTDSQLRCYFDGVSFMAFQGKPVTEERLRQELDNIRAQGYSVCDEEYVLGIFSLSFPVEDKNGHVLAFTLIMNLRDKKRIITPAVLKDIRRQIDQAL